MFIILVLPKSSLPMDGTDIQPQNSRLNPQSPWLFPFLLLLKLQSISRTYGIHLQNISQACPFLSAPNCLPPILPALRAPCSLHLSAPPRQWATHQVSLVNGHCSQTLSTPLFLPSLFCTAARMTSKYESSKQRFLTASFFLSFFWGGGRVHLAHSCRGLGL